MATKAQIYHSLAQRSAHPPKPKKTTKAANLKLLNGLAGSVSGTNRKLEQDSTALRNASIRAKRKGGATLEDSTTGKPSRKSTRKSEGHIKAASNLQRREMRRTRSPKARAMRASVSR